MTPLKKCNYTLFAFTEPTPASNAARSFSDMPDEILIRILFLAGNPQVTRLINKRFNYLTVQNAFAFYQMFTRNVFIDPLRPILNGYEARLPDNKKFPIVAQAYNRLMQLAKETRTIEPQYQLPATHYSAPLSLENIQRLAQDYNNARLISFCGFLPADIKVELFENMPVPITIHEKAQELRRRLASNEKVKQLEWLSISNGTVNGALKTIPPEIKYFQNLRILDLKNTSITYLPPEIGDLVNIRELDLHNTPLACLPSEIGKLKNLVKLHLNNTLLTQLPPEFGLLENLQVLILTDTPIAFLPPTFGELRSLRYLYLTNSRITFLPPGFGRLINLEMLYLSFSLIAALPPEIATLAKLRILSLTNTPIYSFPNEIALLVSLSELQIQNTPVSQRPTEIAKIQKVITIYK